MIFPTIFPWSRDPQGRSGRPLGPPGSPRLDLQRDLVALRPRGREEHRDLRRNFYGESHEYSWYTPILGISLGTLPGFCWDEIVKQYDTIDGFHHRNY
jgi:hypothetical protein